MKAAVCSAEPKCPLCAGLGQPSYHRMGALPSLKRREGETEKKSGWRFYLLLLAGAGVFLLFRHSSTKSATSSQGGDPSSSYECEIMVIFPEEETSERTNGSKRRKPENSFAKVAQATPSSDGGEVHCAGASPLKKKPVGTSAFAVADSSRRRLENVRVPNPIF